jgi:hypothetical protein
MKVLVHLWIFVPSCGGLWAASILGHFLMVCFDWLNKFGEFCKNVLSDFFVKIDKFSDF